MTRCEKKASQQYSKYGIQSQGTHSSVASSSSAPLASLESMDTFTPKGKTGLVYAKPDVSASHVRKADWIIQALPEGLQEHFRRQGCQVKLARTMDEIFPDLRGKDEFVTNVAHTRSWKQIKGCARGKIVGIPEYIQRPDTKKWVPQSTPSGGLNVERHELGHLLHDNSNLLHDGTQIQDGFWEAYTDDLNSMTYSQAKKFRYLIQTKDSAKVSAQGMRETFAEVAAAILGGGCHDPEEVMKAFPNTTRYLYEGIKAQFANNHHFVSEATRFIIRRTPK